VLYVPSEVPNKVVAEFLGNHGKVETITTLTSSRLKREQESPR
jgi:hypothetical protein